MKIKKFLSVSFVIASLAGCSSPAPKESSGNVSSSTAVSDAVSETESKAEKSETGNPPELTGNTEQDYENAVAYYKKRIEDLGPKCVEDFKSQASGFEGTTEELAEKMNEAAKPLVDVFTSAALKMEAIFAKDDTQNQELKDKYGKEIEEAYNNSFNEIYAEYMNAAADLNS